MTDDLEFDGTPNNARLTLTIRLGSPDNARNVLEVFPSEYMEAYEAWLSEESAEAKKNAGEGMVMYR